MKKVFVIFAVTAIITSCNDSATTSSTESDSARAANTADSIARAANQALEDSARNHTMDTATANIDTSTKAMTQKEHKSKKDAKKK